MVGLQTLDLAIGVRVPASQPKIQSDRAVVTASEQTRITPRISATILWFALATLPPILSFSVSAQSRKVFPQPTPTPQTASPSRANVKPRIVSDQYKFVFSIDADFSGFVEQLNKAGEQGYRLKSAIYGWQRLSGRYYGVPVAILQLDEGEYEYAWFETTSKLFFAIPGFEQKFAEQAKRGFRVIDHFVNGSSCEDSDPDSMIQIQNCETSYVFLLQREKGVDRPQPFILAETYPRSKRNMGEALTSQIREKLPDGFYPTEVLSSYQILLAHTTEKDHLETDTPDVQVVTSSFLNDVKKEINELGQQGFQLALIREEAAVMYRHRDKRNPFTYDWLNAKNKNFEKELAKLQESGAAYRMIYRDTKGGNQLVFERGTADDPEHHEYKRLKLNFQIIDPLALKHGANGKAWLDLTPASKETVKLINTLVKEGFVVRDLFVSATVSEDVSVLLERSRSRI